MLQLLGDFGSHLLAIVLEASPWLLLGLLAACVIRAWFPTRMLTRWLGGAGLMPLVRAAVIGTPLPLCSCSVLPAAVALRRGGASKGATTAFLIATPENGADSIALSYAMLGPVMTIVRPVAACISAIATGIAVAWTDRAPAAGTLPIAAPIAESGCCDDSTATCCEAASEPVHGMWHRTFAGVRYAMTDLFADIALWLIVGLVLAAVVNTFVSPQAMSQWGSGLPAMLLMLAVGVPMYICATASTPVAAAMLAAGISPGTALVFLLAGPATNLGSVGVVRREMGTRTVIVYLVGIGVTSIALGLMLDWILAGLGISVAAQAVAAGQLVPAWLGISSAGLLGAMLAYDTARRLMTRGSAGMKNHVLDESAAPATGIR